MSRFGIQLKQRHDMKHMTHIATLALSVLLALTACERNRHTPEEDKVPLSFSALSQNTPTKADGDEPKFPHSDFGVWGYATQTGQRDYLLWEANAMSPVNKASTGYYPASDAYWFSGYDYNFIAIAPYTGGAEKLSDFEVGTNHKSLSFTFDMGYSNLNPGIDLMGAIAETHVDRAADKKDDSQDLTFQHLTSKIDIKVKFDWTANDVTLPSAPIATGMRLKNVDGDAAYEISYTSEEDELGIDCTIGINSKATIPLALTADDGWWTATTYIHPQRVSGFELFMNFKIGEVTYDNFPITLTFPADDIDYDINEWHTWKITLTPSLFVLFEPSVTRWTEGGAADDEIGFN